MPTTFCKSSYFGHNMLKTPVLPDAKLGFLDGLTFPKGEGITQLTHNLTNHRRRRYHNSTLHTPHLSYLTAGSVSIMKQFGS